MRCAHVVPGFGLYERLRGEVKRLQMDPTRGSGEVALHAERDACEMRRSRLGWIGPRSRAGIYSDADWVRAHRRRQASRYGLPL
jgi:hypothetical protein